MISIGKASSVFNMRYKSGLKRVTSHGREMARQFSSDEYEAMNDFEKQFSAPSGRKKIWESWGDWYRRNRAYWFELAWRTYSDAERQEIIELDEFCVRYLETGRWSYV